MVGPAKGNSHRHFHWKWGKWKVQRNRFSSEILKPSQTGAGRSSRKFQGLAIILRGCWLCLLGAHFCFLNLPSFRLKGNMCLPAAGCFHQPASCGGMLDCQHLISLGLSLDLSVQAGIFAEINSVGLLWMSMLFASLNKTTPTDHFELVLLNLGMVSRCLRGNTL